MNIAVVGAGLMGRVVAWQLLRAGESVTLFDQGAIAGEHYAGRVAAAMLAPYSEAVSCEAEILQLGLASLSLWPSFLSSLGEDYSGDIGFQCDGSIIVAHNRDANLLLEFRRKLNGLLNANHDWGEDLSQQQLQSLESELVPRFQDAIYLKHEGCVDNWALLDALASVILDLGGVWRERVTVTSLTDKMVCVEACQHHFDRVIDTRGLGAKSRLPTLRGVRGEVIWVRAEDVHLHRPVRLMHPRYQLYIVPKPQSHYVVGATELESESMQPITVQSSLELQSALFAVHTGFAEANIIRSFAHCRPAFFDNLPRVEYQEGVLSINGLYRHGYLLAPLLVIEALALLGHTASFSNAQSVSDGQRLMLAGGVV